jgi:ubiquinone biosynthesis protein Coq4
MREAEAKYLRGENEPLAGSILISTSRYLNNPLFRDMYAQMGLKKDGYDLPAAYLVPDIGRAWREVTEPSKVQLAVDKEKAANPSFRAFCEKRFVSNLTIDNLTRYKEGTLGWEVCTFMKKTGFDLDFMFKGDPATDFDYLNKREVQNHDISHMVTGLDPSPVGEIALAVCNLIANQRYFSPELAFERNKSQVFLISTSIMRTGLHYPEVMPAMLEAIAIGQEMGKKLKLPLAMVEFESFFDKSIEETREALGIEGAPPNGVWEWTYDAARG